ncbi:MAG TPA: hypothetical protein DD473_27425 [Planctomycetaceae bacterium]|nr:hypothetical protein [Planctomycetaceae bacterium]
MKRVLQNSAEYEIEQVAMKISKITFLFAAVGFGWLRSDLVLLYLDFRRESKTKQVDQTMRN